LRKDPNYFYGSCRPIIPYPTISIKIRTTEGIDLTL
jgi:hypothetical protein